ncbi:tRNA lysidine(34) synthetase TilS [Spirosoma sp. KUDC1026]|nr:tRNA lysidine(34) synthetase TilS [Spirosoma sp. KUDC1026]
MEQAFLGFINDNQLLNSSERTVLAVSGGLDSVAMAELFYRTNIPFAIAHVNFGLRGADSEADAVFVKNKAEQYGVPFHLVRFDTQAEAARRGISIQMAARELRYTWFNELCQEHKYPSVATAHHQNDVLETLLLNLSRGTGLAGLHGILPKQPGLQPGLIRPLLFATRDQLADYVMQQQLPYREDRSNAEDKYARNRIRHHVTPVLTELNAGFWPVFARTVERLRAADALVQHELEQSWQALIRHEGEQITLPVDQLRTLRELPFRLGEWLKPFGFSADQVTNLTTALEHPAGQVFRSATHQLTRERNVLVLEPLRCEASVYLTLSDWPTDPLTLSDAYQLECKVSEKETGFVPTADAEIAWLDADQLRFPVLIRKWKQGDRFQPLNLKGSKLVSNLLNDLKISRREREQCLVLEANGEIAWVMGYRIAHKFRITEATTKKLRLRIRPLPND